MSGSRRALAAAAALVLACSGCTNGAEPPAAQPTAAGTVPGGSVGPPVPTCPPTAELTPADGGALPERQGFAEGGTLWALFFPREPRLRADIELKIVWRMTGGADFAISAAGPNGVTIRPVWGPELHGGSSWTRPGAEWGTGWVFPEAGCWTFTARSGPTTGQLTVRVA